jgi:hypothetical protein
VATRRPDEWLPVRSRTTEPGLQADFHSFRMFPADRIIATRIRTLFHPLRPTAASAPPQLLSKHIQFIFYPIKNKSVFNGDGVKNAR